MPPGGDVNGKKSKNDKICNLAGGNQIIEDRVNGLRFMRNESKKSGRQKTAI